MARRDFQESLDALRSDVTEMGHLVLARLDDALHALDAGDVDAAEAVIDGDAEINQLYLDLESACIDLFALQQPVASDLRFVAASFKILTDLERIGDLATNLAGYALAADSRYLPELDLTHIGTRVHDLVADAIEAYADNDAAACREIDARDDEIDALCHTASERVVRELIERRSEHRLPVLRLLPEQRPHGVEHLAPLLLGGPAVRRAVGDSGVDLLFQPADAFHEELVGVLREVREEPKPLQGWVAVVHPLVEDPFLEAEFGEFAVEVVLRVGGVGVAHQ